MEVQREEEGLRGIRRHLREYGWEMFVKLAYNSLDVRLFSEKNKTPKKRI